MAATVHAFHPQRPGAGSGCGQSVAGGASRAAAPCGWQAFRATVPAWFARFRYQSLYMADAHQDQQLAWVSSRTAAARW